MLPLGWRCLWRKHGSSELTTPAFELDRAQPITRGSIAALDDAFSDYTVNYDAADPFPFTKDVAPDAYVDGSNEIPYVANKHKVWVPTKTLNYNIIRCIGGSRLLVWWYWIVIQLPVALHSFGYSRKQERCTKHSRRYWNKRNHTGTWVLFINKDKSGKEQAYRTKASAHMKKHTKTSIIIS